MMSKPTRILIVEDMESDFELAQLEIRRSVNDCIFERVDTRQEFLKALETFQPDVVLSDYSLPHFDGMSALKLVREKAPLTPFIIWTGSMSEDTAVECMKAGANNYILKENIKRLGPAIIHAVDERQLLIERREAEDKLRRSISNYRALTENSVQGIAIFQNSRMVYANPAICTIMGYTAEELMEMSGDQIIALTHPDDRTIAQDRTRKRQAGEFVSASNDLRIIRKDGTIRWIQAFSNPVEYNGQPAVLSTSIDITERKLAEEKYQDIFEHSQEGIFQSTPEGRFIKVNPAMARIYGYDSPQDMIDSITSIAAQLYIEPEDRNKFTQLLQFNDHMEKFEMRNFRKDKSIIWTHTSARTVRDANGNILYYEGFLQDITERKLAEQNLRKSEKRFRALIENSLDNISLLAADGTLLWENPAVNRTLGYGQNQFVNRNIFELMHPDDMGWTSKLFAKVTEKPGSQEHGMFRLKHRDGTWRWIEATATNMLNEPSVEAIVINYRDITERKQAEIEVQQKNDDLRLINAINEAVVHGVSLDGIMNMLTRELKRIFATSGSSLYMLSPDGKMLTMQQYILPSDTQRQIEKLIGSTIPLIQIPVQEGGFFQKILTSQRGFITSSQEEIQKWMMEFLETPFLPPAAKGIIRKFIPQIYNILSIKSTITIPLILNGEVIGILDISSTGLFTENDLKRIENISRQLTTAIQRQQTNEQVHRSEAFLQSVQNALSASIAILNEEGVIVQVNSAWRKFGEQNGLRHPEYGIGSNYLDICDSATGANAEEAHEVAKAIREVIVGQRREIQIEYPCHSPEEKRWFVLRITKFGGEEHVWVVLAHENITALKEAEEKLRQSEARFSKTFSASPVATVILSLPDQRIVDINQAALDMWSVAREEVIGKTTMELGISLEELQRQSAKEQITQSGTFRNVEIRLKRDDGEIRDLILSVETIEIDNRPHLLALLIDITERKQAEQALLESEKRYRALFEDVPVAIWEEDFSEVKKHLDSLKEQGITDFRAYFSTHPASVAKCTEMIGISDINNTAVQMFEAASKEELIRISLQESSRGEQEHNIGDFIAIAEGKLSDRWEGPDETCKGNPIEIRLNWSVVPGYESDYSKVIVTTIDITERKQAETAEREQRALAEALRDTAETLNGTLDYGEVLDHILTAVEKVVPHDTATILLIDKGIARVARARGYEERGFRAEVMEIELSLIDTVNLQLILETGQPVVVPDTRMYPGWKQLAATEWLRSNVGAPISIHGEVIGFILLDSETPEFFTSVHVERLKAFANQAAIAIQNARLLRQAQDEIVERQQAEAALRESEEKYRLLFENNPLPMWIYDLESLRFIKVNDAAINHYGYSKAEFMAMTIKDIRPSTEVPRLIENISQVGKGIDRAGIWNHIKKDGSLIEVEIISHMVEFEGHRAELVLANDVTERLEAERELRASEERFRQLADNIQEVFWMTDAMTGEEIYISPASEKIWGRPIDIMMNDQNAYIESILSEDRPQVLQKIEEQRVGLKTDMEYRVVQPDGTVRWVWDRAFPVFDEAGKVVRLAGIAADITERKQTEEALRKNEQRLRIALAGTNIAVFNQDMDLRYTWMYQPQLGYTSEQVVGKTDAELLPMSDAATIINIKRRVLETGKTERAEVAIHAADRMSYYDLIAEPLLDSDGTIIGLTGSTLDITDHKNSENEIRRHLAEMEALYENGLAVGRLLTPHEIGNHIIETFAHYLSWHHVAIRLVQPASDNLELIAFNQPGMSDLERIDVEHHFNSMISKVEQGLSGWVVQTGEPFRTGNVHTHPRYVDTHSGIQSGLYMPLKVGAQIIGVISVESEQPDAFTLQDERLLATLANQAAIAFENARLYQTNQQERERFSELFENTPVATWLEDFSAVISWMDGLRAQGVTNLKEYLENDPQQYKLGVRLINILDVNHAAVVMNGARNKEELIEKAHGLMMNETPSQIMIDEMDLIWKGYTSFGFEMSSYKLDGSMITGIQRVYIPSNNNGPDYTRVIVTSTDITDRVNFEKQLRTSEVHYRELADSITDIFFEMDQELHYSHWNKASEMLTGLSAEYAIGKSMHDVFGESDEQTRLGKIYRDVLDKHQSRTFETTISLNNQSHIFEINAYPSTRGVAAVAKDVTERKRSESLMQKRFELMEYSADHGLEELMQKALDELSEWTHSAIGFFQLIREDQITSSLQVWSTDTFQHFHSSRVEAMHKPADQAGVWAEAVHQRRAVIHNDYESLPGKKGLPEDHAPLLRELVLPIIRNERIVAVIGVGNKSQDYTRDDLEITERFADYAWDIIERKQMVIELAEERNQLAKRVEERTSDLSRANSNLARALRVKDEFLANMSHELRTPLNAILGLSESLGEQTAGPLNEKQQRYLTTISESGHHLLSLINDILDLAKIEAGQITLDINKVDVNSVSQASLRMIKQLAQKKNLDVLVEVDKKVGLMWADERRLKQMMVNLLSNAVKFTPEGGKIGLQIDGNQEDNKVTITVWDTGIGIKESDFERLFQPFVQLDSGLARESSGTGLGLALVAQMARLHGGSVNVQSDPDKGSRFTIVLPWEPALAVDTIERMKVTGKFRAIRPGQVQQTILLIEDTQEVVMMIKDYLEMAGYIVATAQDGLDGLAQAKFTHPDLILMDIQMPRMDGLEATQKLRQDPEFKYTPIIALTALAMPSDRDRCIAAGMDEYISKPVNLRGLVKLIQNYLSLREEKTRPR